MVTPPAARRHMSLCTAGNTPFPDNSIKLNDILLAQTGVVHVCLLP